MCLNQTRGEIMILILLLIFGAVSASAGNLSAAEPFADWKYHGQIQAPPEKFVALPLTPQILDRSEKSDLSDFRIVDARGSEIPYAVVFETEMLSKMIQKGKELNRDYPDPSTSRITVDFGASVTKDKITVETEGNNFRRFLRVEGSDDLHSWATILREAWIIAAGDTPEKRFESFDIGSNNYRYMRVSVSKMAEEKKPPEIKQVSFRYSAIRKPQETAVQGVVLQSQTKDGKSTFEVDFGFRNLSMQRFQLMLGGDPARIFEKKCELSGRNSLQHAERIRFESGEYGKERTVATSWEPLGFDSVYHNTKDEMSMELKVHSRFRYVRIEIENGNNPPLDISGVTAYTIPTYLVFEPARQSRFEIYTGNPDASAQRYESSKVLGSLDTQTLMKCAPMDLAEWSGMKPKTEPKGQKLVWVVLAIVVLFTAGIFWNTARSIGKGSAVDFQKD
jgi:hypothetical protein